LLHITTDSCILQLVTSATCFGLDWPSSGLQILVSMNPLTPNDPYRGLTTPLTSKVAFYISIQQIQVLNILNMVYTLRFFSSKCSLFHNSNVFGYCIIHILYTGCAKIKKKQFRHQKFKVHNVAVLMESHGLHCLCVVQPGPVYPHPPR